MAALDEADVPVGDEPAVPAAVDGDGRHVPLSWRLEGGEDGPRAGAFRLEQGQPDGVRLPARHVVHARADGSAVFTIVGSDGQVYVGELPSDASDGSEALLRRGGSGLHSVASDGARLHLTVSQALRF